MQKLITQNQHKISCSDTQLQSLNSKISTLEKDLLASISKWEKYEGLINNLNKDKNQMIEKIKYEQLLDEIQSMQREFNDIKQSKSTLVKQVQSMAQLEGDNQAKMDKLNDTIFEITKKYEQIRKENETMIFEIKSLKNVLEQKELIINELSNDKSEEQFKEGEIAKTIEKLRKDREALIIDNTTLHNE